MIHNLAREHPSNNDLIFLSILRGGIAFEAPVGLQFGRQQQTAQQQQQQQQQAWTSGSPYVETVLPPASQLNRNSMMQPQVRPQVRQPRDSW